MVRRKVTKIKGDMVLEKKVIGITGGVGTGKSSVLKMLREEFNAEVIQADEVANQLMEPGEEGYEQIVAALGRGYLLEDGTLDRPHLSQLIFSSRQALKLVNNIIHPMVWKRIDEIIRHSSSDLIVVEAALLQKEKDDIYDELWYLYTSRENRLRRLEKGRGYSEEKTLSIMANQPSEEEFAVLSQRTINNNGTLEETRAQLQAILKDEGR